MMAVPRVFSWHAQLANRLHQAGSRGPACWPGIQLADPICDGARHRRVHLAGVFARRRRDVVFLPYLDPLRGSKATCTSPVVGIRCVSGPDAILEGAAANSSGA